MSKPSTEIKKVRKLTPKQAKFVKGVTEGKPAVRAAMDAYPTVDYSVANAIAGENLRKPSIAQAIEEAYERQGITIDAIVKPVADGLVADKVVIVGKDEDAFADLQPDHSTRLKAAGMAAMWLGIGKQPIAEGGGIHFHQHVQDKKSAYND